MLTISRDRPTTLNRAVNSAARKFGEINLRAYEVFIITKHRDIQYIHTHLKRNSNQRSTAYNHIVTAMISIYCDEYDHLIGRRGRIPPP
jgi:hypothetical protein